ncbi:MAG: peptide chain release factor N(5)-glutamine methyltransferase [Pseudohongiellaceae bacterium]
MKTEPSRTVKQALELSHCLQELSDSWKLDGELLLAHVLGKSREYLYTWPDAQVSQEHLNTFRQLLDRRSKNEPVAYLTGRQAFWDFELAVNPHVLIPRPETEVLVEKALELAEALGKETISFADLGTGSGAIAIALAKQNTQWQVTALDKSEPALAVAEQNAAALKINNIHFVVSSWCAEVNEQSFDIIAANPPYVETGDQHLSEGSLPFEPIAALVASNHGLSDIQQIVKQSAERLNDGGWLVIEHGFDQSKAVVDLLQTAGFNRCGSETDLAGIPRIAFGQWLN